ncbi:DUF4837 family protein [bacterium]|nr:DUF4837 family protein [bacterium]
MNTSRYDNRGFSIRIPSIIWPVCFLAVLSACHMKPRSWWHEGRIAVIADEAEWEDLGSVLRPVFERVLRTPQEEKTYEIFFVPESRIDAYGKYRYLLLAATLESGGPAGRLVQGMIADSAMRRGIEEGEYFLFQKKELWAKDQTVSVLVAPDMASLRSRIESSRDLLYDLYDSAVKENMTREMYDRGYLKDEEEDLFSSFGWGLRLQKGYFRAQASSAGGVAWFRRMQPERWIFVRWVEEADTSFLNEAWAKEERDRIGQAYYGGDRVADSYLFSTRSSFLGRPALITTGLWENEKKMVGGPFRNIVFFDRVSGRVYMMDMAVFAPGQDKLPYLKRMDVIAGTFRTIYDRGRPSG